MYLVLNTDTWFFSPFTPFFAIFSKLPISYQIVFLFVLKVHFFPHGNKFFTWTV